MSETVDKNRGHLWILDEDGDIDTAAYDIQGHNGPRCSVCGYAYCHHCDDGPTEDCPGAEAVARKEAERSADRVLRNAAPDLLAALESFPGFLCGTHKGDAWIEQMRAAIARAKGSDWNAPQWTMAKPGHGASYLGIIGYASVRGEE